ncbi:MAG: hypothetical protein JO349_02665 [Candidatus Eremiobacteraeota bacterium]|nr:hypothetical protein [Candidatus Eremiobacteraeota bacterium]
MTSRRRVPIQAYLAAVFALVVLAIGVSTAALFFGRMKAASLNAAAAAFDHISSVMAQRVLQIRIEIGYKLALATGDELASAKIFAGRLHAWPDLIPILHSNKLIVAAYVGYPNGDFLLFRRIQPVDDVPVKIRTTAVYVLRSIERVSQGMRVRYTFYDDHMRLLAIVAHPEFHFDPRNRPWFAAGTEQVYVTDPYIFFSTHHLGLTYSQRAKSGAVFGADVDITSLSDQLKALRPTASALVAGVEPATGFVFAFSNPEKLNSVNREKHERPATVADLQAPPLAEALKLASQRSDMQVTGSYRDAFGRVWLYDVKPGRDSNGEVALYPLRRGGRLTYVPRRVLVLTAPEDELIADALRVRNDALIVCLVLILTTIPVTYLLSKLVSIPLGALRGDALALRNLDFSERPSRDSFLAEIGEFSDTFGAMRGHIRDYNHAATRFVPREFLEQLGRNDIKGLQLGDHAEGTMTVLFSDIRSFTTLSGSMTPEQTFKFVNSYLTRIGPIIREYGGFIDKYIGDAIMALFPDKPRDAADAAVSMQRRVVVYNEERARAGYKPVAIGIGIHYGDLMMGTIGETLRFETTVISDAVNIASRLESLTKTFGVLILASSEVMAAADATLYCSRRLGDVQVKGATHPVTLYEICDADPPSLLAHKMDTREVFDIGRVAYAHGDFTEAYRAFHDITRANSADRPAVYYRDRAAVLASSATREEWDGVDHMETK